MPSQRVLKFLFKIFAGLFSEVKQKDPHMNMFAGSMVRNSNPCMLCISISVYVYIYTLIFI